MRLRLLPALLLFAALLAGCSGKPAVAPPEAAAPAPAEPAAPMEQTLGFGWAAGTGTTPGTDVQLLASGPQTYEVGDGAALLTANVTWTCSSPTCDMHAYLCEPDELAGTDPTEVTGDLCSIHAMGGSPLALQAEAPAAGEWTIYIASDGPSADVSGSILVTES